MSTPVGPCDCCSPWGMSPKGATVTISGVKDLSYPVCDECDNINNSFVFNLEESGTHCSEVYSGEIQVCGPVDLTLRLERSSSGCRWEWHLAIGGLENTTLDFEVTNLLCCNSAETMTIVGSTSSDKCDTSGITVSIAPFGDWDNDDLASACLPALAESCPAPTPVMAPKLDSQDLGFGSVCPSCGCDQGSGLGTDWGVACTSCSGQSVSPINGNMAQTLQMPSSDRMAPSETLVFNSAPIFGKNSQYADATMESPPAGSQVSGFLSMRLIPDDSNNAATTIRCDGSLNMYRCRDSSSGQYWPVATRNSLTETVNGSGTRTGWQEVTQPDGFTWNYDAKGNLTSMVNPAGQSWSFNRASAAVSGSDFKLANSIEDPLSRRMTYTYDSNDKLRRMEGVDGRITTVTMDVSGNLTKFITPELCTTEFRYGSGYASSNQMIARINEDGTRTSFAYEDFGWLGTVETPNQGVTSFVYGGADETTVIQPSGTRTSLTFNESRQITAVTKPDTDDATVEASCSTVNKVTKPSGTWEEYKYEMVDNKYPRMLWQANPEGRTTYVFDNSNDSQQPDAVIDRQGQRTSFTWDSNGQQTSMTNALNETTTYVYDSSSRPIATIDALGNRSTVVYNTESQPQATINPLGNRTSYTYSANGQPLTQENPLGAVWTSLYDENNRPVASIDPLGNRNTTVYGSGCMPVATVTPMGSRTTSIYAEGQLAATINPLGHRTSFTYNTSGNRIRSQSPEGLITTTVYDVNQRPLANINPSGLRTTNVYDATGRVVAQIAADETRTSTVYDTCCSKPKATIAPNGARTSYTYNAAGLQIRTTAPTGGMTTLIYDDLNRKIATIDMLGHRSSMVYDAVGQVVAQIDPLNYRNTSVYDAARQSVATINPLGNRTTSVYDTAGQVAASINPLGNRWSSVYDTAGRMIASTDPLGRRSTSIYNDDGQVIANVDPEGGRSTTLYDAASQTIGSINARNFRTTQTYDADGQAVEFIDGRGYRTTSVYDAGGRQVSTVDARGNRSTTVYNSKGQAVASENALGNRWTTVFNAAGQPAASVDPLGNRNTTVYDSAGRGVAGINPLGNRTTTIYNIASQVVATEDALNNRTTNLYDGNGRAETEISALGYRTTTVYDNAGQRTALVDARSNRHSFVYDDAGQETIRIDPLARRTSFGYDAAGQQDRRTDARGNRTTYTYSDNGQITSRRYPDGSRATFTYDAVGNRTLMANATGRYSYTFDGNGQTVVAANPNSKTITYAYDAVGNRAHMDAPDAGRFTYVYDATNQITLLHNAFDERTSFAYDNASRRTVKRLANGTRASYTYDAASNLTNLHNLKSDNSAVSTFDYRYNAVNNRLAVGEANGDRVTWTYDDASQLTSEDRSGANAYRNTFVYDPVGNRLVLNEDSTRTTTVFDAANQMKFSESSPGRTTYTFDADGNQQVVEIPSNDRTTNVWDYENRMTNVQLASGSRSTMTYQPGNLRVTSDDGMSSKTWLWDAQNYLSQTDSGVLTFTNTPNQYGDLVSQFDGTDTNWYHFDARGDARELTDNSETVTDSRLYDAWGNVLMSSGTSPVPFQFIGKFGYYYSSRLVYVRARFYASVTSVWLSVDPINEVTGATYSYAADPLIEIDPSGLIKVVPAVQANLGMVDCVKRAELGWLFQSSRQAGWPCDGYLTQRVKVTCKADRCDAKKKSAPQVVYYFERWEVTKGQKDVDWLSNADGNPWTDAASFEPRSDYVGSYEQEGEIRLFCIRKNSDRSVNPIAVTGNKLSRLKSGRRGFSVGTGVCRTKAGSLIGGKLTNASLNYYPVFWEDNHPQEPEATRSFKSDFNCCSCPGPDEQDSTGFPIDGAVVVPSVF